MTEIPAYSRSLSAAARLGAHAEDHSGFLDKQVLLTGEKKILATENGRYTFLASLRLLPRICRHVSVALPSSLIAMEEQCRALLRSIQFDNEFAFLPMQSDLSKFDAILSVGTQVYPELPWTAINSNGWITRVSSGTKTLSENCEQTNAVGAMAAASLGAGEVFKRLIRLRETRGSLLDGFLFSLHSFEHGADDAGPALPKTLPVELFLMGVGAIGNGVIHLLRGISAEGRIYVVDREKFCVENVGTCLLIGPSEVGVSKAAFAAAWLGKQMQVKWWAEEITEFRKRLSNEVPYPKVILNCLDNIEARHEIQDLWPDLIIDGAIGDFPCQVSVHPWSDDVACLRCLFKQRTEEVAEQIGARVTGLKAGRVRQPFDTVTEEDVANAAAEKREWLRRRLGKNICSVVREGVSQEISSDKQALTFQPSVPFVASFSASMVVGEMIKHFTGERTILDPRFQCDMLRGPHLGLLLPEARHEDCVCVTRRKNIDLVRASRQQPLRYSARMSA